MRITNILSSLFLASLVATGLAACSGSPTDNTGGTTPDAGNAGADGSASSDTGSKADTGNPCIAQCITDSECANSCNPVSNGVNCCHATTGVCYTWSGSSCPAPTPEGGSLPD